MPTRTYIPLATSTLSSSSSSITFSSIPSTYRDLFLVFSGSLSGNNGMNVRFNGDNGSTYTRVVMGGNGSSTFGGSSSTSDFMEAGTIVSTSILHIIDYSATDKFKSVIGRNGPSNNIVVSVAGTWQNTAAINSITVSPVNQTMLAGCSISLYGIGA